MNDQVVNILEYALNISKNDIINVSKLDGLTNLNFKVDTTSDTLVVRIAGKSTQGVINRKDEKENILLVNKLGLEPDLLFFDTKTGNKISKFILNSTPFTPSLAKENLNMKKIAKTLNKLHNADFKMCCSFNIIQKIELYEKECKSLGKIFSSEYFNIKNYILNLYNEYKPYEKLCPCHNDLLAENILISEDKLYIVDWEYAGTNDFMWDIACCSLEWGMTKNEELLFLKYYLGTEPTNKDIKNLTLFKVIQDFIWYLWSEIKVYSGEDFKDYSQSRLDSLNSNLLLI